MARRQVQLRGQSLEVLDLVLRLGQPAEPPEGWCGDCSDRLVWMPGRDAMLRNASVRKVTNQLAGNRKDLLHFTSGFGTL